jgi:glutamyl-Q tRNA(Asp) synthetase
MSTNSTHQNEQAYRGRFAPSPTGPLHFGSLVAATASYLDARSHSGSWIVRMEDLDTQRVQIGADEGILADLEHFGFTWDGPVLWQSRRTEVYREVFHRLQGEGLVSLSMRMLTQGNRRFSGSQWRHE